MKKFVLVFGYLLLATITFAQAPPAFKYQAVARDLSGNPLIDTQITVKISILTGRASETVVYSEQHQKTTNSMGLFNLEVGNPQEVLSGSFENIVWGVASYFLKVEINPAGGPGFQLVGISQLLSVPFALNSSSLTLTSTNGATFEVTVDDEGNLSTKCIPAPTEADAGTDQTDLPNPNTTLEGNIPVYGNGTWSIISGTGGIIENPSNPSTNFNGMPGSTYILQWAITTRCGTSTDEVSISFAGTWTCGMPLIVNHIAGEIAPVDKTVTYGTVTNIPGEPSKCWITRNLGASMQAMAVNDAAEASGGWYWQFNRKQGYKHDNTSRTPNTAWISNINETTDWVPANDPCALELGTGWRIPTNTEWTAVDAGGNWANWNFLWNSGLKIHAAGNLYGADGALIGRGSGGYQWSSTQNSTTSGYFLFYGFNFSNMSSFNKANGLPLRCLKE